MKQIVFFLLVLVFLVACSAEAVPETAVSTPFPATATRTPTTTPVPFQPTKSIESTPTPEPTLAAIYAPPDLNYLAAEIEKTLNNFEGIASYVVVDLSNGERIEHNPDVAIAGMSLIKIPILIETFAALDNPPDIEQTKLLTQTTSLSSNFAANLLLKTVIGPNDTHVGGDRVTEAMRELGVYNTFIAVPYDLDPRPDRQNTYLTPANQRTDLTTKADIYRQTTVGDLAELLLMLYDCAENDNGRLREAYPQTLTQLECQEILDLMQLNDLVQLLEAGLPNDVSIAHKIGYIDDTYGDASIIYSPNRDYLLVLSLYAPDYLEWAIASPLFAQISALAFAHFNDPQAYAEAILAQPPVLQATTTPLAPPDKLAAIVAGTQGIGLTLRDVPAGNEITILPEGSVVYLLDDAPTELNNVLWRNVILVSGENRVGWCRLFGNRLRSGHSNRTLVS